MIRCKLVEYSNPDATQSMMRVNRSVAGERLVLGRGASCQIYLPDARVRLEHAVIRRAGDGSLHLDGDGPVFVNQHPLNTTRLLVGQQVSIGPYDFVVESLDDAPSLPEAQLVLSYVQRTAAPAPKGQANTVDGDGVLPGWVTRRRLAWLLCIAVLLFCSAVPVWRAYHPQQSWAEAAGLQGRQAEWAHALQARLTRLDTFWNPGQLSSAHRTFAQDCLACHARPFERVADTACTACHKNTGDHVPDKSLQQVAFQGERCASCHKEHQGTAGMRTVDAMGCEQCHGNIRAHAPQTALPDISDFARQHPDFRLSIRQPGVAGQPPTVQRVAATPALRNDSGLKFPHALHLDRVGIKSPTGPAATGGRVQMECANCHTLDAAGVRYQPVRMDQHCQSCHRLSVDPQAPERQVPHASPLQVRTAVREIYASLAVDRFPVNLVTVNSLLQRPTGSAAPAVSLPAGRWVQMQSDGVFNAMFEARNGVCVTCHAVEKAAPGGAMPAAWQVRPVVSTAHWLPKTGFSHTQHQSTGCVSCHDAANSRDAADILVPAITACRTCHAGAVAEKDKIVSRCDNCHGFHGPTQHPAFRQTLATEASKR